MQSGEPIPRQFKIIGQYDKQKFIQFNPEDTANWYIIKSDNGKNESAMYPTSGRRHIRFLNSNKLIFTNEPRAIFKSVNYYYVVVDRLIHRFDANFNEIIINTDFDKRLDTLNGDLYFTYLIVGTITFSCFTDGTKLYIYREDTGIFYKVTDPTVTGTGATNVRTPTFIATFGNRIVLSAKNSSFWWISIVNLGGAAFDPATCFGAGTATFNQADGIVGQFGVLHNQLYIFCDYVTEVWSNIPSVFNGVSPPVTFPFKKNTTYNFDYGIQDPQSLDVDFGLMVWLAQNRSGQIQVMASDGGKPQEISTKAITLLFERDSVNDSLSPFVEFTSNGFLYQEDNVIFYRLSAGKYNNDQILDLKTKATAVEFNFDSKEWHRVTEMNGERNRVKKQIFFANRHLVTVLGESTVYEMSGQFYNNENRNPLQPSAQAEDAYVKFPFRYQRVTPIIHEPDDGEFETKWVQIDFVWGEDTFIRSQNVFSNTNFIIDEDPVEVDGVDQPVYMIDEDDSVQPVYMITEGSDIPQPDEPTYREIYKPHVELYWSDNGGVMFYPADVMEFSQLGYYRWRMRWYQLGVSRNRVYKLVVVSPSPMVVLNGLMLTRRVSGGAS